MAIEAHPEFLIQSDWNDSLKDTGSKVWITLKERGKTGIHGSIIRATSNEDNLTATDGFKIISYQSNSLHVGHESTSQTAIFVGPAKAISGVHNKSVSTISINSLGHAVSASTDEKLVVWDTLTGKVKLDLKGHVGDVYKCRFFPSGEVVLSCGSDMRLMIWCAKTGVKAVTLTGHTMAVTDADFVDRGRNVISSSKDGTLRLWNCGDSSCLATLFEHSSGINCCTIFLPPAGFLTEEREGPISDKECGTKGKAVLVGCEDGTVHCIDLYSRKVKFSLSTPSCVNCVAAVEDGKFLVGCQDGSIHLYSLHMTEHPKRSWHTSNSAICSIYPYKEIGFFASRADGNITFKFYKISTVMLNLTGANADPVYDLDGNADILYSCSRDSIIRMHAPSKLISKIIGTTV
ncbi:WD domain, G-beta repeat [Nesidiocoris tenuis]|uniref:WD domain, G-beta repeat n=1 Tax=Nesidiocoris tenuis TaxID=355587 RepID=A0ABN7BBM1_9HEMI|nr:WD domain, G-beta repeat [Nesidiocoris tenuis]